MTEEREAKRLTDEVLKSNGYQMSTDVPGSG